MLNLDDFNQTGLPKGWEFTKVLNDVIMVKMIDEDCNGNLVHHRSGIIIAKDVAREVWRVAEVIKVGHLVKEIQPGDKVMFPNLIGIRAVTVSGEKYVFMNEARVFGVVEATEPYAEEKQIPDKTVEAPEFDDKSQ